MAIETTTLSDGTKKYRGRITRLIDGKRKGFNTPYVSSVAEALRLQNKLSEQYPPITSGRKPGSGLGESPFTDKEAYDKYKTSIDKKFKQGVINTKKWSEMTTKERQNVTVDSGFTKKLDERVIKFKLGGKNVELPKGMRLSSFSGAIDPVQDGVKKLQKWNKNPTSENWSKIFKKNNFGINLRSYLANRDSTSGRKLSDQTKKIFDSLNIKQFVNNKDIKTISNLDTTLKEGGAKLGSIKSAELQKARITNEVKFANQDEVVKNFIKGNDFGKNKIRQVSTYLGKKLRVSPSIAARRIQELAKAYLGNSDFGNFKSKNANFMKGVARINNIVESSPFNDLGTGFKRDLYETYISKSLGEKPSFTTRTRGDLSKVTPKGIAVDEVRNIATGAKVKNPGYSVFIQGIDENINLATKRKVDSAIFSAETKLQELSPFDPNYDEKRKIIKDKYNKVARDFAKEANVGYKGNLPVRAFELSFDEPSKSVSRYSSLPKNVTSLLDSNYKDFEYSFKVPKDVKTMYEVKKQLNTSPTNFLKKVFSIKGPRVFQLAATLGTGALALKALGGTSLEAAEIPQSEVKQQLPSVPLKYDATVGSIVNATDDKKADQNQILEYVKDNPIKVAAGTSLGFAAEEIPGAYRTARGVGERGPLPKGKGRIRSALGISGALRPVLTTFGTPLVTGLYEGAIAGKRLDEGETMTDILTDPVGPALGVALMEPLSKLSGVVRNAPKRTMLEGAKNYFNLSNVGAARPGITGQILRMGMSPRTIAGASRFLGLPGVVLGAGLAGYDAYKNYQNKEGMIYNLFNKDE